MLGRTILTAIAISYILCLLLMSGLHREDIDANTVKKLERHNVNIDDMNNETLRKQCLGKLNLDTGNNSQQLEIIKHESNLTTVATKRSNNDEASVQITELQTLTNCTHNVKDLNNNVNEIVTKQQSKNEENRLSITTEINNTKNIDDTNSKQTSDAVNNWNILQDKSIVNALALVTGIPMILSTSQKITSLFTNNESIKSVRVKQTNDNYQIKGTSVDHEPNILISLHNITNKYKETPALLRGSNIIDINVKDLVEPTLPPVHSNKRELSKLALSKTNPRNDELTSELQSKPSETRGLTKINESVINYTSELQGKPKSHINGDNFVENQKDTPNNSKLEDWYSNTFLNNKPLPLSSVSNNIKKDIIKLNSKESLYLGYDPLENYSSNFKIINKPTSLPQLETETDVFDVNSFLNNYDKVTEGSKEMFSVFNIQGPSANLNFLANIAPSSRNKEDVFDPSQFINDNNPLTRTENSFKGFPDDISSPKNKLSNNENMFKTDPFIRNDYTEFQTLKNVAFFGNKPKSDSFISSFRKKTVSPIVTYSSWENNDDLFNLAKSTTSPDDYRISEPLVTNEEETHKLSLPYTHFPKNIISNVDETPRIIPPFLEGNKRPGEVSSGNFMMMSQSGHNNDKGLETPSYQESKFKNHNTMPDKIQNMQFNLKPKSNEVTKGDKLKLITNSLRYINQILAMDDGDNSSIINTTHKDNINQLTNETTTEKLNVIKQRKNKASTKLKTKSNYDAKTDIRKIQNIPDFINEIAESVKKIILKDIRKEISTAKSTLGPYEITTAVTTTIYPTTTILSTTDKTTPTVSAYKEETKDTNYVMQKILELFRELKSTPSSTSTSIPLGLTGSSITGKEYFPKFNGHYPLMPALNPYGIGLQHKNVLNSQSQIVESLFTDPYKQQMFKNDKSAKASSLQPQISNQMVQFIPPLPQILTPQPEILNQPPHKILNKPMVPLDQQSQIGRVPQMSNQVIQVMNPPPLVIDQTLSNIYGYPHNMFNPLPQIINQPVQMITAVPELRNQAPKIMKHQLQMEILKQAPQTINQPSQILNQAFQMPFHTFQMMDQQKQMIKDPRVNVHHLPQILHQPLQMNHAEDILNKALQTKNQEDPMINPSSHILGQSERIAMPPRQLLDQFPQYPIRSHQIPNIPPQIGLKTPPIPNPSQQMTNEPIINMMPQFQYPYQKMTNKVPQLQQTPQINFPFPNGFRSPNFVTFQTNAEDIPPLNMPLENPTVNHVIIVPTNEPTVELKERQFVPKKWLHENRKEKVQTHSNFNSKLKVPESHKRHEFREPYRNRSNKYKANSIYKTSNGGIKRVPYKSKYKNFDYERTRPRHVLHKFHEELERSDEWSEPDRKKSRESVKDCCDEVSSREQVPMNNMKQRSRYDDTHFRNFLKTQEKVNDMLERILATKTNSRAHSVEIP